MASGIQVCSGKMTDLAMAETSIRKKIVPVKAVFTAGSVQTKLPLALNSSKMAIKNRIRPRG